MFLKKKIIFLDQPFQAEISEKITTAAFWWECWILNTILQVVA